MKLTRKTKLVLNTGFSMLLQITTLVSGFILPRIILGTFGSNVNGLVNSIAQFLNVITLLDLGVGAVVESALYKPLAEKDNDEISRIFASATKFFKRLAMILLVYVVVLVAVYPMTKTVREKFDYLYTASLIVAISISTFAQYYFGIVNSLVLNADQKSFIQYSINIATIVLNTIACYILVKSGFSIQIVKLTTSLIFLCRPLFLNFYVRKNYNINRKIKYTGEPIKQKWNGMAQHFAYYILMNTDNVVLTIFSTLANVSIYSVYNMVIVGVKNALMTMTHGFKSIMGEFIVKKETERLRNFFSWVEWVIHTVTVLVFGCTGVLIVSFVRVYTKGISDANYIQPLFAFLITLANAGHCLRMPYHNLTLAAGHYKQTQGNYITATVLNIVISIATVKIWGLIGVSIGTLIAMFYQTFYMAWYGYKNIIQTDMKQFIKQMLIDLLTVVVATLVTFKVPLLHQTYFYWAVQAAEVFLIWIAIVITINLIFYRDRISYTLSKIKK